MCLSRTQWRSDTFYYRKALGLVALASSEQTVLEVNVYVQLVERDQMTKKDETQEAPGSFFLARPLHSKKKSEWHYQLRQFTRS